MKQKVDSKTKNYTAFLTEIAVVLKKYEVKDLLVVLNINGQIRNTYLPCTGVEDPLYCNLSDGIHEWLQLTGRAKRDAGSFKIPSNTKLTQK